MGTSWFTDHVTPHDIHRHELKKVLLKAKTRFQHILLAETYSFGRCLILDGELQSAERDEFIYHEALVHPAMALHPKARTILVLGGGEGATVREIVRHPAVRQVTMVDIDGDVVQLCKKYLSSWHQGAFSHPALRLVIGDAKRFMDETRERFDIIISDLPTPQGNSPIRELYSARFYRRLRKSLSPDGILVVQSGSGSRLSLQFHQRMQKTLSKLFKLVRGYYVFVPSFGEPWSFLMASRNTDPLKVMAADVDKKLGTISRKLRFYDGQTHEGLFRIPKYLRKV